MDRNLLRRLAQLETRLGFSERRLRRVAERLHVDPERLLQASRGHERHLAGQIEEDGTITWEGLILVLKLMGHDLPSPAGTFASSDRNNAKITQNNATDNASLTRPRPKNRPLDHR